MLTKIYFTIWAALAAIVGVMFISGNLTALAIVAIGFFIFGMIFMGMMVVLPLSITHPGGDEAETEQRTSQPGRARGSTARIGAAVTGLFDTKGVEVRNPRFH